jgi:hypothetical protein
VRVARAVAQLLELSIDRPSRIGPKRLIRRTRSLKPG